MTLREGEWARPLLDAERDRAERLLNAVRAMVLFLLAAAAVAYASRLPPELSWVNVAVLVPTIAWTVGQYALFYRRPLLPKWVAVANPVVDITAVTLIVGGYGVVHSPALALKSPIFLAYFVILAGRPIASSTRRAAFASLLVVGEYTLLLTAFVLSGRVAFVASPVVASAGPGVALLDEGAKVLLLAVAGGIATYATQWHERLAMSYFREASDREQLEVRLTEARLESLKLQLSPHFLFNTLNTIVALISTAPRSAERMVAGLSELLRVSLRHSGEQELSLERELEVLRPYIEILRIRFNDRLVVDIDAASETRPALVPHLLLQPLVENAMRHGIAPRAAGGRVVVRAERAGERLLVRVSDDGVGLRGNGLAGVPVREGVGLGNTRARLQQLYGDRQRFDARAGEQGGFTVTIDIPYHTTPVEARRTRVAS